jgi:phosphatidylglycerophosphate synthase
MNRIARLRCAYWRIYHYYVPKPRRTYEYPINYYYAHRLDPLLTWLADRCGCSPNGATLLSLCAGLGAASALLAHQFILAALLIQGHHLLDGVDGNLARVHQRCTEWGRRFDLATDQSVRFALFVALAWVAPVPVSLSIAMILTIYIDLALVLFVFSPCARRYPLYRQSWKQWFLDRGLLPGFDIFTLYAVISLCLLAQAPDVAVVLVTIFKTSDWLYRAWECLMTIRQRS